MLKVYYLVLSYLVLSHLISSCLVLFSGIATVANWTANAIVVASYLSVADSVGEQSTFIIYMVRGSL